MKPNTCLRGMAALIVLCLVVTAPRAFAAVQLTVTQTKIAPPGNPNYGNNVQYKVVVTNTSTSPIHDLLLRDSTRPDCNKWFPGPLAASDSITYECTAPYVTATFTSTLTATARYLDKYGCESLTVSKSSNNLTTTVVGARIDVAQGGPGGAVEGPDTNQYVSGETVAFTIKVSNPNQDITLTNITLSDAKAPECKKSAGMIPDLAPGKSFEYTCEHAKVMADFTNTVTASALTKPGTCPGQVSDTDTSTVDIVGGPKIDIRQQLEGPDSREVTLGANVPFTIVVTNTGYVSLTNVAVTDTLLPGCTKHIGSLASGASVSYTCTESNVRAGFTSTACVKGHYNATEVQDCDDSSVTLPEPQGTQGCGPGYWKQSQHFDSWVGYTQNAGFEAVFGRDVPGTPTLLAALELGGGGLNALMRQAVAALLNAANPNVAADPRFNTTAEVIAAFQAAVDSRNYEATKDLLEASNEQGCPLN